MSLNRINELKFYPTSVFQTKISSYGIFNQEFEKYIYNLKNINPKSESKSIQKGWHSPNLNLNDKVVTKFINTIDPILESIMKNLNWDLDQYFIGYQSIWSIINDKYSYNTVHHHGNALLSLAYYVKIPKDVKSGGELFFKDYRSSSQQRKPPVFKADKNATYSERMIPNKTHGFYQMDLTPREGDLIIFPGWMEHGVRQSKSNEDRIVISANIDLYPKIDKIKPGYHANYRN